MLIILHKPSDCYAYRLAKREPITADLLADFLTDDVGSSTRNFIQRFKRLGSIYGSHNATRYWQEDDNVIFVTEWAKDDDEEIEKGHYFTISAFLLMQLLNDWEVVYSQQPPYIIIKVENDIPVVVGSDELPDIL